MMCCMCVVSSLRAWTVFFHNWQVLVAAKVWALALMGILI